MNLVDITGRRFGRLTVVKRAANRGRRAVWSCHCECGATATVRGDHLRAGLSTSCGCALSVAAQLRVVKHGVPDNTKHGHGRYRAGARTSTYVVWCNMIQRCTNPRNPAWDDYGGRGITVCDRWRHDFAAFLADMGERPDGLTLDRVDNDRGYGPDNCRWATWTVQRRNQRARKVPA